MILSIFTLTFVLFQLIFNFSLTLLLEVFFHTSSSQTRVTSVKSYTFRNFLNHITFPFTWSILSHFIFPDQGHISKILHIPRFPKSYHIPPELRIVLFKSWNIVVRYLGSEWPWSNRCPILLGCHLIYRNIKSIIMFHLLWNIYCLAIIPPKSDLKNSFLTFTRSLCIKESFSKMSTICGGWLKVTLDKWFAKWYLKLHLTWSTVENYI